MPLDVKNAAKVTVANVALGEAGLTIAFADAEAYFNYFWLRDNCPSTVHPQTGEKHFDIAGLAADPVAESACIEADALVVEWRGEAHESRFDLGWLRRWAVERRAEDPAALPRKLWSAGHYPNFTRVDATALEGSSEERLRLARALVEEGVAIVTGMEDSDAALNRLTGVFADVTPTGDGLYFDVKLHIDPNNAAFTAGELEMHTDLPSEDYAPGVQFLHCRANSVEGGNSLFLDGAAVAETFRREHPEDFELLASYDIPFRRFSSSFDYRAHQRVIELDLDGEVSGVSISQHLLQPMDLPQALLDRYYPAFRRFIRMMKDPRFLNRFRLNAGECIVFDNHRIVHGREAFSAESGQRHLRGCYVSRNSVRSVCRVLAQG